jgi:ABC-type uncharacterized transport system involved in gliding motility auxiliary subunit
MKLHKYYSIDECNDEQALIEKLEALKEDGKIEFELLDQWTLKIKDLDLTSNEEKKLIEFLDSMDLYDTTVDDDDDDDSSYEEYDEFEDDYKPRRGSKSYDDDFDDF